GFSSGLVFRKSGFCFRKEVALLALTLPAVDSGKRWLP
ncbi:unnamed protein product, partial [Brassica rapa subsp. trilocularis]